MYLIALSADGRPITLSPGCETNYFNLLEEIGKYPYSDGVRPARLIADGTVVVESGLHAVACEYVQAKRVAIAAAERTVKEAHYPAWMGEVP